MITYERQQKILEYLRIKRLSNVAELSELLFASQSSIRRDIKQLESQGYVVSIYGGVILAEYKNEVIPVSLREKSNSGLKDKIAKIAASYVFDGATIMMDGSSSARKVCNYLDESMNLRIITNNYRIVAECALKPFSVFCTGGYFDRRNQVFLGSRAEEALDGYFADILFFSSQALSLDGEITDVSEEETSIRRHMFDRAKKKIFLCDSSKIGEKRTFKLCDRTDVDVILCDGELPF